MGAEGSLQCLELNSRSPTGLIISSSHFFEPWPVECPNKQTCALVGLGDHNTSPPQEWAFLLTCSLTPPPSSTLSWGSDGTMRGLHCREHLALSLRNRFGGRSPQHRWKSPRLYSGVHSNGTWLGPCVWRAYPRRFLPREHCGPSCRVGHWGIGENPGLFEVRGSMVTPETSPSDPSNISKVAIWGEGALYPGILENVPTPGLLWGARPQALLECRGEYQDDSRDIEVRWELFQCEVGGGF